MEWQARAGQPVAPSERAAPWGARLKEKRKERKAEYIKRHGHLALWSGSGSWMRVWKKERKASPSRRTHACGSTLDPSTSTPSAGFSSATCRCSSGCHGGSCHGARGLRRHGAALAAAGSGCKPKAAAPALPGLVCTSASRCRLMRLNGSAPPSAAWRALSDRKIPSAPCSSTTEGASALAALKTCAAGGAGTSGCHYIQYTATAAAATVAQPPQCPLSPADASVDHGMPS